MAELESLKWPGGIERKPRYDRTRSNRSRPTLSRRPPATIGPCTSDVALAQARRSALASGRYAGAIFG